MVGDHQVGGRWPFGPAGDGADLQALFFQVLGGAFLAQVAARLIPGAKTMAWSPDLKAELAYGFFTQGPALRGQVRAHVAAPYLRALARRRSGTS